jgi:hypothetical protein
VWQQLIKKGTHDRARARRRLPDLGHVDELAEMIVAPAR